MSKLAPLVRAGLKANFGLAILYHRLFREKKDRWVVPLIGVSLLGVIPMLVGLVKFVHDLYFALKPMGQERFILTAGLLAGQFVILIFGLYYVISAFYFSRDMETLIPLPVRASEIMLSKFIIVMINEYLTVAIVILPILITFGIAARSGVDYWIHAALVYLALPIIPLAIVSLLVVVMMRLINVSRKKDLLIIIGSIALLAFVFGIQYLASKADNPSLGTRDMAAFLSSPDSLMNQIGAKFPPSIWGAKAISGGFSGEGLINLALLLGVSLLCLAALVVQAEQLFFKGLIGLSETSARRRTLTQDQMSRQVSSGRRAISAIFMREWRIMNRTPIFLINCTLGALMLPALVLIMGKSGGIPFIRMSERAMAEGNSLIIILIAGMIATVCGSINSTAPSAFSREGAQFWISQVIPVAPGEQVAAKFLHSYLIGILGIVATLIAMVFLSQLKAAHLIVAALLALTAEVLLTALGMIIDLARPLLDWTNPQKAVKQNLNVMIAMLLDIGILTAAFFGVKALIKTGLSANAILFMLFAALIILSVMSFMALLKFADKRYREIEN